MLELTIDEIIKLGITNGVMIYLILYMTKNITQKLDLIISKLDNLDKA